MNRKPAIVTVGVFLMLTSAFLMATGGPRVPETMEFAGIILHIDGHAREQIQKDVDALRRNDTYFQRRLVKIDMYFPVIERIFEEEEMSTDFKYLVIQESALVPDAVSTSNAVGFWQFKEATAVEMGLRVDRHVDERMNIVSSTRAAAKYLKKQNYYLDNWVYALLAYNTGLGGVASHVDDRLRGAKQMNITAKTHWYVKKFLAHKIAYEKEVSQTRDASTVFYEYTEGAGMTIEEVARLHNADIGETKESNKWLLHGSIPNDHIYTVLIPLAPDLIPAKQEMVTEKVEPIEVEKEKPGIFVARNGISTERYNFRESDHFPVIVRKNNDLTVRVNGILGTQAKKGDTPTSLAIAAGISLSKFLSYNDMVSGEDLSEGQVYYFKKKKTKAGIHYHVTMPGESLWDISQKYGIRLKKLLGKNRMRSERENEPGRVVWLRFIRPVDVPIEYKPVPVNEPSDGTTPVASETNLSPTIATINTGPISTGRAKEQIRGGKEVSRQEITESTYLHEGSFINLEEEAQPKKAIEISPDDIVHTVKAGETLFSITQQYKLPLGTLREWNGIDVNMPIYPGQKIIVGKQLEKVSEIVMTPQSEQKEQLIIHKVETDETLYGIAKKYGVGVGEIMQWNNKKDFTIDIDEELQIYLR